MKNENNLIRKKKPEFTRYNSEYLKKLNSNWRRARGIHNKVRLKRKGHPKAPSIGYRNINKIRGFYKSQFDYKIIDSEKDLENLDKNYVILSSKLGLKKRLQLINKIKSLNLEILNIKDVDKFVKQVEEKLKQNKEKKKKGEEKKEVKKAEVIEKEKKELTKEEKLEKEKLEKKKVLEKGL